MVFMTEGSKIVFNAQFYALHASQQHFAPAVLVAIMFQVKETVFNVMHDAKLVSDLQILTANHVLTVLSNICLNLMSVKIAT